jgi:NitT/TauT family transport system substrate-binding protein
LGALAIGGGARAQEKREIVITRSLGINYLPMHVVEHGGLIERHAARLGVDLRVTWVDLPLAAVGNDALLTGRVDILNTGVGNLLLLWDRTRGGVKGIVATSAQPLALITRNPSVRTLGDFGPGDRIAVPIVRASTQAILLQMACAETFGPDQWARLDPITVQLSHPDAAAALANANHEVNSHFSSPPYSFLSLRTVPGAHEVPLPPEMSVSQLQLFTTTRFAEANPIAVAAVQAATLEAIDVIRADRRAALTIYRELSRDRTSLDDLVSLLGEPGMMNFNPAPRGTMRFAEHLRRIGSLRAMPAAWTDYYLPIAHDLGGS